MITLTINHFFDAAHQLTNSEHLVSKQCARLHGHTYLAKITITPKVVLVPLEEDGGMIVDFTAIKNIVNELDHRFINDVFTENVFPYESTAENIALFIQGKIYKTFNLLESERFGNVTVELCEGYKGEKSSWVTVN